MSKENTYWSKKNFRIEIKKLVWVVSLKISSFFQKKKEAKNSVSFLGVLKHEDMRTVVKMFLA